MRLGDQRSARGGQAPSSAAARYARARHGRRAHRRGPARRAGLLLAILGPVLAAILLWSAPASSLSQRGHEFAFSFGEGLPGPVDVAVDEHRSPAEGNVYVALSGGERVERYRCTTVGCELDPTFKPKITGEPEYIAIDNSPTSPSKGDLYVGYEEEKVEKFDPSKCILKPKTEECKEEEGGPVFGEHVQTLKTYKLPEEFAEEIGEIHGLDVDAEGNFYLFQAENIVKFNNAEKVKATEAIEPFFNCEPKPGFAAAPKGEALYVGHELETRGESCEEPPLPAVIAKLDSAGNFLIGGLDLQQSSAAAVDLSNGNVYVDNLTSIAEFDSSGALIQRFGSGDLEHGRGLAVDAATEQVYVADNVPEGSKRIVVFGPEGAGAPEIDGESAENVTPTSEQLSALIDPKGEATNYFFEYGTENCATSTCTHTATETIPAGFGDVRESVTLTGLQPGTPYYFRVVAENGHGTVQGPVKTFETLPSSLETLADNRAWELVSPPEKSGASIFPILEQEGIIQAAAEGGAVAYIADSPIESNPEGNRAFEPVQVIAHRGSQAWSNRTITTRTERGEGTRGENEYQFFSPDLSLSLVEPRPDRSDKGVGAEPFEHPPLSPKATERTLYIRDEAKCQSDPSACFEPLVTAENVTAEHEVEGEKVKSKFGAKLRFLGASQDLGHVVFESDATLTSVDPEPEEQAGLYEWSGANPLELVSLLPPVGQASCSGLSCEPALDPELGTNSRNVRNAVSSDGSRVIWTGKAAEKEGVEPEQRLYMRDTQTGETVQVDRAQGVKEPEAEAEEEFQTASVDGTKVFFTNPSRLTLESTLGEEAAEFEQGYDLYVCEAPKGAEKLACSLKDLTVGRVGESADVQGVLGASEDGSIIYFVANGVLGETEAEGARPGTCTGTRSPARACNLYSEHFSAEKGEWEPPVFIARLPENDGMDWNPVVRLGVIGELRGLTSRVSPNGRYLAFMSESPLTGYDNRDANPAANNAPDEEVFLYDSSTGRMTCVSCNPSGERPHGVLDTEDAGEGLGLVVDRARLWENQWLAGSIPGWSPVSANQSFYQSRYLSDEGRLFFNSADALVPQDTNEREETVGGEAVKVGVEDVYEYEPAGVGGCKAEGCVALISAGKSSHESAFVDASVSGDDAYFVTGSPLVAADRDTNYDLYDARVCTSSSPCLTSEVSSVRPCEEEHTCKPNPPEAPAPSFGAPLSSTFSGPGNTAKVENRGSTTKPKPKAKLTRKQKLAKALKACRKKHKHNKKKLKACERQARKKYGAKHKGKHAAKRKR